MENTSSEIASFFANKNILITGGTGFLGKVLVFKLLNTCKDVGKINLIIRHKKGWNPQDRLKSILQDCPAFEELRCKNPQALDKVQAIEGDITKPKLGLSTQDEDMLKETVSIIFHSAATVKFDDELTNALNMNVRGTEMMIYLAKEMKNLVAFVHVSTAYCHCNMKSIEEKLYLEDCLDYKVVKNINENTPQEIKADIIKPRPNTYTFSKAMAEQLLNQHREDLPIAILRPSIVVASSQEPCEGWVDNINGPTSIIAAAGSGLLRSMWVKTDGVADLIPVDYVINMLCAVAYSIGSKSHKNDQSIPIYHCTSGSLNPLTWKDIEQCCLKDIRHYPMEKMFWYPDGSFKNNKLVNDITNFFSSWIPAVIYDFFLFITRNKTFMIRLHKKMFKGCEALEYFANREWQWQNDNSQVLQDSLNEKDKELFYFDISKLDWNSYMRNYVHGTRKFVMKYKDETIESSKKKLKWLYLLHVITCIILLALPMWIFYQTCQMIF